MKRRPTLAAVLIGSLCLSPVAAAQERGEAEGAPPGDEAIQAHLDTLSASFPERFLEGVTSAEDWWTLRPRYQNELLYMLGLWPVPERTPLHATVTGELRLEDFFMTIAVAFASLSCASTRGDRHPQFLGLAVAPHHQWHGGSWAVGREHLRQ